MKALFSVTYDHYRWQDFICASGDLKKLEDNAKSRSRPDMSIIYDEQESNKLDLLEENHFLIIDIVVL